MLIDSPRLRPGDLEAWERYAAQDRAWASTSRFARRVEESEQAVVRWARGGGGYAGVSWGKDSTALAHLVARLTRTPLVWVRVEPICSPECALVRNAFVRSRAGCHYVEIERRCRRLDDGYYVAAGTLESGFREAGRRFGARHLSGIRAEESAGRERFARAHGSGDGTESCAPLIRWSGADVFAYLALHDLPVHPAYAMSLGGALPRDRLRVASIGGKRGRGMGRLEWEQAYYPDVLAARGSTHSPSGY